LYRRIAEQLRSLIDGGEFAVGSRLPAERELATQLRVSRPSVREALIAGSVDIGPKGKDPQTGHGRLDACKAIQAAAKREMCGR